MSVPAISVVMCCYNAERYIRQSIDSILNQSFTDFEYIIWNDGSTDKTEEIIKSYKDNRIKYFYHENLGIGGASKKACEKVSAKYIARMDSDVVAMPNRLQVEYEYLDSHKDTVLVSSAIHYIDEKGDVVGRTFPYTQDSILRLLVRGYDSPIVNPSVMFRTDVYVESGGYYPLKYAEDRLVFARMSKFGKFANIPCVLLKYRLSSGSISSSSMSKKYQPVFLALFNNMVAADEITDKEIRIYNELVELSKEDTIAEIKQLTQSRYRKSIDERLYNIINQLLTDNFSLHFVCMLKNCIGHIRYGLFNSDVNKYLTISSFIGGGISVVISTYNDEKYIAESIQSILNQTYPYFELIIVNDGSTDNTLQIVKSFDDPRIVIIDKPNTGLIDSLNVGVKAATYEWIARMDGDDVAEPTRFEEEIKLFRDNVVIVSSQCSVINEFGVTTGRTKFFTSKFGVALSNLFDLSLIAHPTVIFNKSVYNEVGGYDPLMYVAEDYDLWAKMCAKGKLAICNKQLLKLRKHGGNISSNKRKVAILNNCIGYIKKMSNINRCLTPSEYESLKHAVEESSLYKNCYGQVETSTIDYLVKHTIRFLEVCLFRRYSGVTRAIKRNN